MQFLSKVARSVTAYDENAEKWSRTCKPGFRAKIKKQEDNIKQTLAHLSKNTKTKKDPEGRKVYLLHRGMSLEEFLRYFKPKDKEALEDNGAEALEYGAVSHGTNPVKYTKNSSWSLDREQAFGFSHAQRFSNCGILVSAWIPEEAIVYGILDDSAAPWEKEIVIAKGLVTSDFSYQRGKTEEERWPQLKHSAKK
jgi:hypothetical protein